MKKIPSEKKVIKHDFRRNRKPEYTYNKLTYWINIQKFPTKKSTQ